MTSTPDRLTIASILPLLSAAVAALLLSAMVVRAAPPSPQEPAEIEAKDESAAVPDRILVRFRPRIGSRSRDSVHRDLGGRVLRAYRSVRDLVLVRIPPDGDLRQTLRRYRQRPEVLYAEPDWIHHTRELPDDPRFDAMWGLDNTGTGRGVEGADIDAVRAWNRTTGSEDVVIAVIDTGVDYEHEDLKDNMFRNECDDNGLDDDGNGYVDDCHGIAPQRGSADPFDEDGHGTHVAGTIGAVGNNGIGVVGVNWDVSIVACSFLGAFGGANSDAIECLDYVAGLKDSGVNVIATNNSWGGGGFSRALHDAIVAQMERGILFVAAAGNAGSDNDFVPDTPSGYDLPNIIAVGASDNRDNMATFTNWGLHSVHLSAPGVDILSTVPNDRYRKLSGTSMAAPHVTGVVALVKAARPKMAWERIRNLVLGGAELVPNTGLTSTGRRLSAHGALTCRRRDGRLRAPLRPLRSGMTLALGEPTVVSMLAIACARPGAGKRVKLEIEGPAGGRASPIRLRDNGKGADRVRRDGVYTAEWIPPESGSYTLGYGRGAETTVHAVAAYGPPEAVDFEWRELEGVSLDLGDDSNTSLITPFPLRIGGGAFRVLSVNSNGTLGVTGSFPPFWYFNEGLPTNRALSVIAPLWQDLTGIRGSTSNVHAGTRGSAPRREFVVEWRDVRPFECRGNPEAGVTFQVVFFEDSSDILFNYADVEFGGDCDFMDRGRLATIGIQVATGTAVDASLPAQGDEHSLRWTIDR